MIGYTTGDDIGDTKAPTGPIERRWSDRRFAAGLVNPANRRRHGVIVVGTGLAGSSAGATLAEQGYRVTQFCFQDSPRRAHSVAAQGGINAAKDYRNDGDSVHRLFFDTVKGGDFRARESNVHRLAEISVHIIDQCVAQGVPFAREYGGPWTTARSAACRCPEPSTPGARPANSSSSVPIRRWSARLAAGHVEMHPRREMVDLVVADGRAHGIVARDLVTGRLDPTPATRCCCARAATATPSTSPPTPTPERHRHLAGLQEGRGLRQPLLHADPPDLHPAFRRAPGQAHLMSECLRNDGRVWVPRRRATTGSQTRSPKTNATTTWSASTRRSATWCPGTWPRARPSSDRRRPRRRAAGLGSTWTSATPSSGGPGQVAEQYGNLFDMYRRITDEDPYQGPMRIYPAIHYTMGGLWVDYDLQSNVPGLFVVGEANFSDHGANRLGASALMQGLADGYFVLPMSIGDYIARHRHGPVDSGHPAVGEAQRSVADRLDRLLSIGGKRSADSFHRELGTLLWDKCGMARNEAGLKEALDRIPDLRQQFWRDLIVPGCGAEMNQQLETANRVADFLELAELLVLDALVRSESCGGHFREESQTAEGEARRDDEHFAYVSAWEFTGVGQDPVLHKEPLVFEAVLPAERNYA